MLPHTWRRGISKHVDIRSAGFPKFLDSASLPKRFIFRMTQVEDCPRFFADGELRSKNHANFQPCHTASYSHIVDRRGDGGLQVPSGRVINDHVAFYFSPLTSMAYTIHMRNVDLRDPQGTVLGKASMDNRVFFVADVEKIADAGLPFWFSSIACNSRAPLPTFSNVLDDLETVVSWDLFDESPIEARLPEIGYDGVCRYFGNKDEPARYQNRGQKRMAEFLVEDAVPLNLFDCIVTKSDAIRTQVRAIMAGTGVDLPVYAKPGCYF